ncbi:MAG: exodeoxyribonuclease VII large subunit [Magnetococcus sp. YQC-3]
MSSSPGVETTQRRGRAMATESVPREEGVAPWEEWLTVTRMNERIRDLLEESLPFVRVQGEISDLHQPPSGHLYFTLLDAQSRIRAVVWRAARARLRVLPRAGESVRVTGRIAVYPPRGEYQLVIEGMEAAGSGTERERFLRLFARLKEEGLFDEARKKTAPLAAGLYWRGHVGLRGGDS